MRPLLILTALLIGLSVGPAAAHDDDPSAPGGTVRLVLPEDGPEPVAVHMSPDTLRFGGQAIVAVDFPAGSVLPDPAELAFDPDLLAIEVADRIRPPDGAFPPTEGSRLLLSVRVYTLDPVTVTAGNAFAPPLIVVGQVADPSETAPVRGPRLLGLPLYVPIGIALAVLLLAALVWWLWRRRRRLDPLAQWEVAPPAWLRAAVELEALLKDGKLDRGETRPFLDDLAGTMRRFLAGRYRVPAEASTGRDVLAACTTLGHGPESPRAFARLMEDVDRLRYGPEPASDQVCRDIAGRFLLAMEDVRIVPRYTPVPAERLLRAEQAWSRLQGLPWLGAAPATVGEER